MLILSPKTVAGDLFTPDIVRVDLPNSGLFPIEETGARDEINKAIAENVTCPGGLYWIRQRERPYVKEICPVDQAGACSLYTRLRRSTLSVPIACRPSSGNVVFNSTLIPYPDEWSWDVRKTGNGAYVGSLAKRIKRLLWNTAGVALSSNGMSRIGSICGDYAPDGTRSYYYRYTECLDWKPGDFGDSGSCIISPSGCHHNAVPAIEETGGAFQFFDSDGNGIGRCLAATLDYNADSGLGECDESVVIYNAYGPATLATMARVLSHHSGQLYRSCKFNVRDEDHNESPIYVNSHNAQVIGPVLDGNDCEKPDVVIEHSPVLERCASCDCETTEDNLRASDEDGKYCADCCQQCDCCSEYKSPSEHMADVENDGTEEWCESCVESDAVICPCCDTLASRSMLESAL